MEGTCSLRIGWRILRTMNSCGGVEEGNTMWPRLEALVDMTTVFADGIRMRTTINEYQKENDKCMM